MSDPGQIKWLVDDTLKAIMKKAGVKSMDKTTYTEIREIFVKLLKVNNENIISIAENQNEIKAVVRSLRY
jgi:hypothetical protein